MAVPVVVVHGGAGSAANDADSRAQLAALDAALVRGLEGVADGAAAAVTAAVAEMESSGIFNAGPGAALDRDGEVSLDAGFMDGTSLRFGAVADVRRCCSPVLLAHHLAADGDYGRLLAGRAADALARRLAVGVCDPDDLVSEAARARYRKRTGVAPAPAPSVDTVGAVALDAGGHLAAAVSTGGTRFKPAGRVGDSPVVGAGFWARDGVAACVTTGIGEVLLREGTARRCVSLLDDGATPTEAARTALAELDDDTRSGQCGLIVVTAAGDIAIDHSAEAMTAGWGRRGGDRKLQAVWRD